MWFRNARLYDLALTAELRQLFASEQRLEEALGGCAFRPCTAQERVSCGFAPLYGGGSPLYSFSHGGCHYLRLTEEAKLLPASVVRTRLEELVAEKSAALGRELRRDEIEQHKSALVTQLVAQAFAQRRDTYIWVNAARGFCAVSASSARRAENALACVREALGGSFPARSFTPRCAIEERMTSWIDPEGLPQIFELGSDVTFRSADDGGATVRMSRQDLSSDEVFAHIRAGKVATDLQLTFEDKATVVLGSDLSLRRISVLGEYIERGLDARPHDEIAAAQAIMILQSQLLTELSEAVVRVFDCERQD